MSTTTKVRMFQNKHLLKPEAVDWRLSWEHLLGHKTVEPKDFRQVWQQEFDEKPSCLEVLGTLALVQPWERAGVVIGSGDVISIGDECWMIGKGKVERVDFDLSAPKTLNRYRYDYGVSISDAAHLPSHLHKIADSLQIPYGYEGAACHHGSHKGEASFERGKPRNYELSLLHPDYLVGDAAKEFVAALEELSAKEKLSEVIPQLLEEVPLNTADLRWAVNQCDALEFDEQEQRREDIEEINSKLLRIFEHDTEEACHYLAPLLHKGWITIPQLEEVEETLKEYAPIEKQGMELEVGI